MTRPSLADVRRARERIAGLVWSTPFVPSRRLSEATGADVYLKLETVQATGSFKMRGAANALLRLRESNFDGVAVTASAGNHGLALATAAHRLGLRIRVHLPRTAPLAKRQALAGLGADAIEAASYDEAEARAHDDARQAGCRYVSPYNDEDIIAGAGTTALEMFEAHPRLDVLVVPVGGGGLLAGAAIVARAMGQSRVTIIGSEATASPVFTSALAAGRPVTVTVHETLADGLAGNMDADNMAFPIIRDLVDQVVTIDEDAIARAMRALVLGDRLVAEGASATAIAALEQLDLAGRRVGVILSGRNVDAAVIERVIGLPAS
ncbi:MAG TPA: pyridoxal-phosphate dependent enzyme [Vicinamibacterales bacterium]|nr:pyridoxal-phosphate dependent enzyme [Vicinamibacterales bacterium]